MPEVIRYVSALLLLVLALPLKAQDRPMGAPLEKSITETEQPIPLVVLDPTGVKASCVSLRLHWNPQENVGPEDEATSFTLETGPDPTSATVFSAQLWQASLAAAMAWQEPWLGARWMVYDVPLTDGSGLSASLAVGMIATSARRPYPKTTVVIGSLNPDGTLGPVSRLLDRLDAAAAAGMTRVIIPEQQAQDTRPDGHVTDVIQYARNLHLDCVPVSDLVAATEAVMNDPLPDLPEAKDAPAYSPEVSAYLISYAQQEQTEAQNQIAFAPQEAELSGYSPRLAVLWRHIRARIKAGKKALSEGHPYPAYLLYEEANGEMQGANSAMTRGKAPFDIRAALASSDLLRQKLRDLLTHPPMDRNELQSALLIAEMSDWVYGLNARLEGAQIVARQAFSLRTDATPAQQAEARDDLLLALDVVGYQINQIDFYQGLAAHIGVGREIPIYSWASRWLPQLIPAELAVAEVFTGDLRERAQGMSSSLLFDTRLATYIRVMQDAVIAWSARERARQVEHSSTLPLPGVSTNAPPVGFDPGTSYRPPVAMAAVEAPKALSDVALCLTWANDACEVATLDEAYLRLNGNFNPVTQEWQLKNRATLNLQLKAAEIEARQGAQVAIKSGLDPAVFSLIYERASCLTGQGDDASALEALRSYWRCALLGHLCAQLAYAPKAHPVDPSQIPSGSLLTNAPPVIPSTNEVIPAPPAPAALPAPAMTNSVVIPVKKVPPAAPVEPPVAPAASSTHEAPRALPVILPVPPVQSPTETNAPPALPVPHATP